MSYPIKSELDRAYGLICKACYLLVMQIVVQKYRPRDTKDAYEKMTEATKVLKNLIDGTAPLV